MNPKYAISMKSSLTVYMFVAPFNQLSHDLSQKDDPEVLGLANLDLTLARSCAIGPALFRLRAVRHHFLQRCLIA